MKPAYCLLLFFYLVLTRVEAQTIPDSLQLHEGTLSYSFYQGPVPVGHNRMKVLMKDCPLALQRYEDGKKTESFGMLLAAIGIVTSAATLGNYHFNKGSEFPTGYLAAGVVCLGVGIPIYFSGSRKAKSSVLLFNQKCVPPN